MFNIDSSARRCKEVRPRRVEEEALFLWAVAEEHLSTLTILQAPLCLFMP